MDVQTAQFLWNAAKLFPSKTKLHCHYLSRCRLIQDDGYLSLPPKAFRNTVMCKFCNNVWMYGKCRVYVASKKMAKKGMKKIIRRQETHGELRPFEKSLIEKYNKDMDNKLVFQCSVCKRKNVLPLSKPFKLKPIEVQNENIETPVQKNKRKKRKDIYAGLNSSVVSVNTPIKEIGKLKKQNSGHMSEPVRGNSRDIHNQNIQHSPQKKKKRKKNKSASVDLSSSAMSASSAQDHLRSKNNDKKKIRIKNGNISDRNVSSFTSHCSQLHAIDTKKGRKEPNLLLQTVIPHEKLQNSSTPNPRTYVRKQFKNVKQQNKASKKRKEIEFAESLKNATKKAKRCDALKKILADSTVTVSSPKTTLKDFFASLM